MPIERGSRLIEWTGERCVPWTPDVQVAYEHYHRYLWASRLVQGRRVLDVGSGEGFGSAILSQSASEVVGIDLDERAVEHASLNYGTPALTYTQGSALDLSALEDAPFDAVVAFEIIEHVDDPECVLGELARVLRDDGILMISTPNRDVYRTASSRPNPFHRRELSVDEFRVLLARHFPNVAVWGQRTVTGSYLYPLQEMTDTERAPASDFYLERAEDEWRATDTPPTLYCVALASRGGLPAIPYTSTLADPGLELTKPPRWLRAPMKLASRGAHYARQLRLRRAQS